MKTNDSIIVGSGQVGRPLVFKPASKGKKEAFSGKEHFGSTCLNTDCKSTKTYVAGSRKISHTKLGEEIGIDIPEAVLADLKKDTERKDALIQKSVDGNARGVEKKENLTYFKGEAIFIDHLVASVNGEKLTADEIYTNVEEHPFSPEGYENLPYLTNQSIQPHPSVLELIPTKLGSVSKP